MHMFHLNDEPARLAALRRYEVLDTKPEVEFAEIVTLVKSIFKTKYAAINLIDVDRQWMKAAAGLEVFECAREDAFCDHTIRATRPLAVEDATVDHRFMNNPFVTGERSWSLGYRPVGDGLSAGRSVGASQVTTQPRPVTKAAANPSSGYGVTVTEPDADDPRQRGPHR